MKLNKICKSIKLNIHRSLGRVKILKYITTFDNVGNGKILWHVQGPKKSHFVITSGLHFNRKERAETFVFIADENGNIQNWLELPGSFVGDFIDHELAVLGYLEHLWKN